MKLFVNMKKNKNSLFFKKINAYFNYKIENELFKKYIYIKNK